MANVPHLVKNLKSALVRGQTITIPQDVVNKEHLPPSVVSVGLLQDLVSYQEGIALNWLPTSPGAKRGSRKPVLTGLVMTTITIL